jgi:hypothetical protein
MLTEVQIPKVYKQRNIEVGWNWFKKSLTIRLKPWSDEEDLAETGSEFQTLIPRANTDPAMYSVDCLGDFIFNALSERENTKESYR